MSSEKAEAYQNEKTPQTNAATSKVKAPPAYSDSVQPPAVEGLSAAFSNLSIPATTESPDFPTVPLVIVHLKLLHAFAALKEEVGFTDGMFDLWDSRAGDVGGEGLKNDTQDPTVEQSEALAKIREKRWALYVARATERFAVYWTRVICKTGNALLKQKSMLENSFETFTKLGRPLPWNAEMLPPLG